MKAKRLFAVRRTATLKKGGTLVIRMDMWEVAKSNAGLFLGRYKLSWIAFDVRNPDHRVLIDAHPPFGIHLHLDKGARASIEAGSLQEALAIFREQVRRHFGELEEDIL